eukprot:1000111_1
MFSFFHELCRREASAGQNSRLSIQLSDKLCPLLVHRKSIECSLRDNGFDAQFRPDGSMLLIAHDNGSLSVIDPLSHTNIGNHQIHEDSVNVVCFKSEHIFVTGSDDFSAKLWDLRKMSESVRSFQGHIDAVKNVEFFKDSHVLTSSFDGSVRLWDLHNSSTESHIVFGDHKLLRMRLSPDHTKLAISFRRSLCIIVHDLDISMQSDMINLRSMELMLASLASGSSLDPYAGHLPVLETCLRPSNRIEIIGEWVGVIPTCLAFDQSGLNGIRLLARGAGFTSE